MPVVAARRKNSLARDHPELEENEDDAADTSLARDQDSEIPDEIPEGALKYRDIYVPPPPPSTCSYDNKGPRLIIKNIVVNNFKSFHGAHTIGPFFKGMSSVIGPNGSGKSNVLDSILFVFGYRASKIRTKKVSMLIHNSAQFPNCNSCTVTVNFIQVLDNKGPQEDAEEIPGTDLEVSRFAFRDNSSHYTLDGKRVQFKDIAVKLQGHGIDLTNGRFLILQGEVEQIAQMKPKAENENDTGLLEFLEEIIGTLRYKEPLAKAIALDTEMEEHREVHKNKADNAQQVLANLEDGKNAAIAYLEEENKFNRAFHFTLQKNCYKASKKIARREEEFNGKKEELDKVKEELAQFEEKSKDLRSSIKQKEDLIKDCKAQSEEIDKKYKEQDAEFCKISANMTAKNNRRKKQAESVNAEKKKLEEMEGLPERNQRDIKDIEKNIQRHETDKAELEQKLMKATETLQQKVQGPQDQLVGLEKELAGLSKTKEEKAAAMLIAQSKLDLATKSETQDKEKLDGLKKSLEASTAGLQEKQERLEVVKADIPKAKSRLQEVKAHLEEERTRKAQLEQKAAQTRAELIGARTAAERAKSNNRVVNALKEECAAGRIPGVYGRLGDLGAINAKYDCAITSVCGYLNYILVDTVQTSAKCMQFLRSANLGKASFISLEQQQKFVRTMKDHFDAPENVPRLFDLIKVEDERVLPAFYFAVRNTLVAQNLDQATRIAFGRVRHKVVDINGNIVDPGGAMTGGGRARRGGMGQKVTAGLVDETQVEQTPQLKQNIEELERNINKLIPSIAALEKEEDKIQHSVSELDAEHKRLVLDIQHLSKNIPNLENQIKAQQERVKKNVTDEAQVAKLQGDLKKAKKDMESASSAAEKIETEVEKLRKEIEEIRINTVGGMDNKLKELNKKITKAQSDRTKLAAAIASNERNMEKCRDKITDLEEEISNMKEELLQMKKQKEGIADDTRIMLQEKNVLGEKEISLQEEYEALKKELNKKHADEKEIKSKKIDVERDLEKISSELSNAKGELKELKNKFKMLKLENIPGKDKEKPFEEIPADELENFDVKEYTYIVANFLDVIKKTRPNLDIIEEYRAKETQFIALCDALEEATNRRDEVRNFLNSIKKHRYQEFMIGFNIINQKLKEVFRMISIGGDAELELQDSFNPFLEGIAFSVRPRNKAWTQIDRLSGGEKTLSSLALVFGLHYFKPSPFYMMDEIDAALDTRNVSIIGHYIKKFTVNCQFIVISLRAEMYDLFERRVIGVFKPDGCTRTVAIDPREFHNKFVKPHEVEKNKPNEKDKRAKPAMQPPAPPSSQSAALMQPPAALVSAPTPPPVAKKSNPAKKRKIKKVTGNDSLEEDSLALSMAESNDSQLDETAQQAANTPEKTKRTETTIPETPEDAVQEDADEEIVEEVVTSKKRRGSKPKSPLSSSQESLDDSQDMRRKSKRQKKGSSPEPTPSTQPARRGRRNANV
ncbi:structural maintenance of chromosomes protein 4 [Neocloeon triangulifer]|uniref:structural maintenance of chromosomes protein 4 n=1 Tax=Neocloeon triangulifer TaxID=2078957 RepID=UPI00286EFAE1|nr:structural maintenance of chromosomes protein 4 [Neocloeon triangulifer]